MDTVITRKFLKYLKNDNLREMRYANTVLIFSVFVFFFEGLQSRFNYYEVIVFARLNTILVVWHRVRPCQSRRDILIE